MDVRNKKLVTHVSVLSLATMMVACGGGKSASIEKISDPLDSSNSIALTTKGTVSQQSGAVTQSVEPSVVEETAAASSAPETANLNEVVVKSIPLTPKDTTAPKVVKMSPADGSDSVDTDALVTATFNEDMFAKTVSEKSFVLKDPTGMIVDAAVNYDVATKTAKLKPGNPLGVKTSYTALLKTDNTDLSGNSLAETMWVFSTIDGKWQGFKPVSSEPKIELGKEISFFGDSRKNPFRFNRPQTAIDNKGNVVAVWTEKDQTRTNVMSNTYNPDAGWGEPTLIEHSLFDASFPRIKMDGKGNAVAVWLEQAKLDGNRRYRYYFDNSVTKFIMANHYTPDSGWSEPVQIGGDDPHGVKDANMVGELVFDMNNEGKAVAVWLKAIITEMPRYYGISDIKQDGLIVAKRRTNPETYQLIASIYTPGKGWSVEQVISDSENSPDGNADAAPQVSIDDSGNIVVLWNEYRNNGQTVMARHYAPDTGWQENSQAVSPHVSFGYLGRRGILQLSVKTNNTGGALALWSEFDGTSYNLRSSHYTVETGWSQNKEYVEVGLGNVKNPQLSINVNKTGSAFAIWVQRDQIGKNIMVSRYLNGKGWEKAEKLSVATKHEYNFRRFMFDKQDITPQIAVDPQGNAIAVWLKYNGVRADIMYSRYTPANGWSKEDNLEQHLGDGFYPDIAMNASGQASVVWVADKMDEATRVRFFDPLKNIQIGSLKKEILMGLGDYEELYRRYKNQSSIKSNYFK